MSETGLGLQVKERELEEHVRSLWWRMEGRVWERVGVWQRPAKSSSGYHFPNA